jgi:hypothetical protein
MGLHLHPEKSGVRGANETKRQRTNYKSVKYTYEWL